MTDRGKVIKGLECCREMDNPAGWRVGGCWDCPYEQLKGKEGCAKTLKEDAIEMLKAQEPVKPLKMEVDHVRKEPVVFSYECPVCMCGLQRHWVACPICGQAVKWDA